MKSYKIITFWLSVLAFAGLTTSAQAYTVGVAEQQNCSVSISPEKGSYDEGDEITVTITPNNGSTFDSFELYYECTEAEYWEAQSSMVKSRSNAPRRNASGFSYRLESFFFNDDYDDEYEEVTEGEVYTFTMPARNVEIEAIFIGGDTQFAVYTTQMENGTTSVSANTATPGSNIIVTATPSSGYYVDEVKIFELVSTGGMVLETSMEFTTVDDTHFSFTMPNNPVRVEVTYKPALLVLYDNADNMETIRQYEGLKLSVQLGGRTLYKDNEWNTLCLPFDISNFTGTPLEGATVKTLESSTLVDGTLTINFSNDLSAIEAGKPYIIKWDGDGLSNISEPVFNNVTINSNEPTDVTGEAISFHGIYNPCTTVDLDMTKLYIGYNNSIYYLNAGMTIGAFRAYFTLDDTNTSDQTNQVRAFVLKFGNGEPTSITNLFKDSDNLEDTWYSLDGRRLAKKPHAPGIYINNGKKVVIK